eukprot:TRINITY_DN16916_c0_g1_i1.p1 TRINITY_DN16916_c0_g1~~TRINITY_DN16916_c0_g1_i1.p1  ORF type:complete len:169 (-),score=10.55 TRINITY_DN16916_c0_g1_i1:238-744(-)
MKKDNLRKKLLFLGPGDSGKSTIFKQLVTLYGKGYTEKELKAFTQNVYGNVMSAIKLLVEASEDIGEGEYNGERLDCSICEPPDSKSVEYIDRCTLDAPVTPEGAGHIKSLWNDPGIQNTHKLRDTFQFPYDAGKLRSSNSFSFFCLKVILQERGWCVFCNRSGHFGA